MGVGYICNFQSIEDQFNFGRYSGLSLADVLDINPSYLSWCIKYCTGIIFQLEDIVIEEIKAVYPDFKMDSLFERKRIWNLSRVYLELDEYDHYEEEYINDSYFDEMDSYYRYAGSWAQEIEGYSDDEIDIIFDGDPSAYWNID